MPNRALNQRGFGRQKPPAGSRVDGGHPLARNLGGAWLFNEYGGTAINDVLGKNKGTYTPASFTAGWSPGPLGLTPNMQGGGGGQYVALASLMTSAKVSVSFACWIVPQATSQFAYILSNGSGSAANDCTISQQDGAGGAGSKLCLLLDGVSFDATTSTKTLSAGVPCFVVVTATSANVWTLYANGVKDSSATVTAQTPTVGAAIGASNGGANPFNGDIALVAWWSRTLSAAEVINLYQEPYGFISQTAPRRVFFGPAGADVLMAQVCI